MIQDQVKALAQAHPVLSNDKLERRLARIERMTNFYRDKALIAPESQGAMFLGFVSALLYATTIIKMYRKLTCKIAELAEEEPEA